MPETLPAPVTAHGVTLDLIAALDVPDDYELLHATPLLENTASTGRKKYWQGFAVADYAGSYTRTVSFQETKDGVSALNVSAPKRVKGKNLGKANETTPADQAVAEIQSHEARQRDKRYRDFGTDAPKERPLPMLAHDYAKRGHNLQWPCLAQPKLDGVRMPFDGETGWSRGDKDYSADVIAHFTCGPLYYSSTGFSSEPGEDRHRVVLDGEMLLDPTEFTFQETMRAVKKYRPDVSPKLEYHVYDLIVEGLPDLPFAARNEILKLLFDDRGFAAPNGFRSRSIQRVPTVTVNDAEEAKNLHDSYVAAGHEGLMLRNAGGVYKRKDRSADLQKMKVFDQDEFVIVGAEEGSGKDEGTAVFVCELPGGQTFSARPKGTYDQRKAYFDKSEKLIGEKVSVRYFGTSEDGVPRFPVAVGVRPDWDLS